MKSKPFDCVAMKIECQRELEARYKRQRWSEGNRLSRARAKADPYLRQLLIPTPPPGAPAPGASAVQA